jgi:hypothetical protein
VNGGAEQDDSELRGAVVLWVEVGLHVYVDDGVGMHGGGLGFELVAGEVEGVGARAGGGMCRMVLTSPRAS